MEQKRIPLLPAMPATSGKVKPKKEPKTYCFDIELDETNDKKYPSFSWLDMVQDTEAEETKAKVESGVPMLNPYASDDEDDLKAMAARFEAKYASTSYGKKEKRKRRAEEFIDKGAGYDESDSFIDNSDIYDEVVPIDLQPAHGGFYINSGALDFKQVEVSEDEDESSVTVGGEESFNKKLKPSNLKPGAVTNSSANKNHNHATDIIQQVVSQATKKVASKDKERKIAVDPIRAKLVQKRRASNSSSGSSGRKPGRPPKIARNDEVQRTTPSINGPKQQLSTPAQIAIDSQRSRSESPNIIPLKKSVYITITSSSSESSSGSSEDGSSSSSEGSSESTGKQEVSTKKHAEKNVARVQKVKANDRPHSITITKHLNSAVNVPKKTTLPQKRLKVKNVPLNPKLHGNASISSNSSTPRQSPVPSMNPLSLNLNQNHPMHLKPLPPLSQQASPNSGIHSDLLITKVSSKDNITNLLKLPTLTPAPTVNLVSPNDTKPKPVMKKLTNRMSCGPARPLPRPQLQNAKARKSESGLQITKASFPLPSDGSLKSVTPQTNNYNYLTNKASSSKVTTAQSKNLNSASAKKSSIAVTQKTFNKIRKQKQKSPEKRLENDLRLNPNHAVSPNYLASATTQAHTHLIQQMMLAASVTNVSSASSYQYPRQSLINAVANSVGSSTSIAAVIPSNKSKSAQGVSSSNDGKGSGRPSTSVIFKGNSGTSGSQKNFPNPPPPPMQYAPMSLPSSASSTFSMLTSNSSNATTLAGNNQKRQQQQYAKHITPFDMNAILSNRKT